ncbi:hypothetical protein [Streptomyces sp. NBC_00198]|uniref:hypothetical protein n=1 Tax=Streptomyces sp. NBC_00198 TaxID=2975677 RepID=UPI00225BE36B|nr:hypothetical protein [Streptomyces sp. NBC_00198]MCX5280693.1 hypothetical protein [Streptomyces sp. NBC_00198]
MRARHLAVAVAAAALLLTGCGGHADTSEKPAPASSPTDLAHLQKLVHGAESAARSAESDMAKD